MPKTSFLPDHSDPKTNFITPVSLDGVACTTDNIVNGTYALQRPFLIVLKEGSTLSEAARGFYDFIMSAEAQTIITANKYVSVK